MSWQRERDEIERRRAAALRMGGDEAVARQHARGRLTVRERIDALLDPGSFREQGPLAGDEDGEAFRAANYVLGTGRIDGRPVVTAGEDFTLRGGSPSPAGLRKSLLAEPLACRLCVPLVRLLEGGGGSVAGAGAARRPTAGEPAFAPPRFEPIARILEIAPVASAALGAVAGFPAARLAASHFSVMTRETSQVLVGGPALVERALGERATKQELGGAQVHLRSGVVDNVADDEADALAQIRRFLSYLPTHTADPLPLAPCSDDPERREGALLRIVPRNRRRVYAMRKLVAAVVDRGSLFELTRGYGRSQITALARLAGHPVAVWANDPHFHGGSMDAEGAQKVTRLLGLCERFGLPIVAFVDEPGFMIGRAAEAAGTIRYGVQAILAGVRTTVPWISVQVRKAFGVAAAAHFGPWGTVLAWPSAESGALPVEGGVAVAFRRELARADDPDALRAELEARLARGRSPFPRAEAFGVHELIDPRDTRPALCAWLDFCAPRLREGVERRRRWLAFERATADGPIR